MADRSYLGFLHRLGVHPEPGQEALIRVAFDGEAPGALPPDLRGMASEIFGPVEAIPPAALRTVAIVAGARSGKSYLFGGLPLLWLALTVPVDHLAPGEEPACLVVAPSKRLGRQALRYVKGAIKAQPRLAEMVVDDSSDRISLRRRGGRVVAVEVVAAKAGGEAGRGFSLLGAFLDEACFFRDEDYAVNDAEVWRAIKPRIIAGGKGILGSTPWARSGLLYETHRQQWGRPQTALVAHAATRTMRVDPLILDQVAEEEASDPDNARREFGAEFLGADVAAFFQDALLDRAVDPSLGPLTPEPGDAVAAAADFGFRRNSSALVVVHRRGGRIRVAEMVEVRPTDGESLVPSEVCATFAAVLRRHGCSSVFADQHYVESVREHLGTAEVSVLLVTERPDAVYVRTRDCLREGRLVLPSHRRLLNQLREVRSRPLSGGALSIQLPKKPDGSHADLVAALVLAVWGMGRWGGDEVPSPRRNYAEEEEARIEAALLASARRKEKQPWWRR